MDAVRAAAAVFSAGCLFGESGADCDAELALAVGGGGFVVDFGCLGECEHGAVSRICWRFIAEAAAEKRICDAGAFDRFGRVLSSYKYPSIRLIKRPKKQKKIEVVRWINIYNSGLVLYDSAEVAKRYGTPDTIAVAVEMRGHYFIEEE